MSSCFKLIKPSIPPQINIHRSSDPENGVLVLEAFETVGYLETEWKADTNVQAVTQFGVVIRSWCGQVMQEEVFLDPHDAEPGDLGQ